jgi:hypothetical protein
MVKVGEPERLVPVFLIECAGTVNASRRDYAGLSRDVILHGSPATVSEKIGHPRSIGVNSLMLHYPPWYGAEVALASLERFAREVMPRFAAGGLALAGQ